MSAGASQAPSGLKVQRPGGSPLRLEELWAERDALLAFVRHFG